jgi:5'-methylthioadenosine phosphorylase
MEGFSDVQAVKLTTPFGDPSDELMVGTLEGKSVAFLPRHARGHRILPSELNFRANVFALKLMGVEWLLSVSAVGSLKEAYAPLDIVIPNQLVDRTTQRPATFFGRGLVAHAAFAHPFCAHLSKVMAVACAEAGARHHVGGSYVCIEGPEFSTLAESNLYRSWGMDIVGMTNMQEARLAREAEICYSTIAMVTDYDCWHPEHDAVTAEQIISNLCKNSETAKAVLRAAVRRLPIARDCECASTLKYALVTAAALVPADVKRDLAPIIGKYMT